VTNEFISVTGLDETVAALAQFTDKLPNEVQSGVDESMQAIHDATAAYPDRPSTRYARTGYYALSQSVQIQQIGPDVVGTVETPAPYAIYLRGDGAGYDGAWFQSPYWQSLSSIIAEHTPRALTTIQNRIEGLIRGLFGE
jgi:hypothetical protein